jgi:hypothetical protein
MTPQLAFSMDWIVNHLATSVSRRVSCGAVTERPVLVFTDGACEGEQFEEVTCGAIVFDPRSEFSEHFGLRVEDAVVNRWKEAGGVEQVIAQAELLPVLLSRQLWRDRLKDRSVLYFIDNSSVQHSLINGYTHTAASRAMLLEIASMDVSCPCRAWYTRVSSAGNPADAPSRLKFAEVANMFSSRLVQSPSLDCLIQVEQREAQMRTR